MLPCVLRGIIAIACSGPVRCTEWGIACTGRNTDKGRQNSSTDSYPIPCRYPMFLTYAVLLLYNRCWRQLKYMDTRTHTRTGTGTHTDTDTQN